MQQHAGRAGAGIGTILATGAFTFMLKLCSLVSLGTCDTVFLIAVAGVVALATGALTI